MYSYFHVFAHTVLILKRFFSHFSAHLNLQPSPLIPWNSTSQDSSLFHVICPYNLRHAAKTLGRPGAIGSLESASLGCYWESMLTSLGLLSQAAVCL